MMKRPPYKKGTNIVSRFLVNGPESRRRFYAASKRLLKYGDYSIRRRLARELAGQTRFNVPKDKGFNVFEPGTFAEAEEVVRAAQNLITEINPDNLPRAKKGRLRANLLDLSSLTLESPYLRLALSSDVLSTVSAYLGVVPVLTNIDVWYSQHVDEDFKNSQLFHCDGEDVTQIKVFVYSTEVDPASGPLVVIGAKDSKLIRDKLGYKYGTRVRDEAINPVLDCKGHHPITGPVGTVAFVDTCRCFHYGSRVQEGATPRILALLKFSTPTAFMLPFDYRKGAPFRHLATSRLSTVERLILGG